MNTHECYYYTIWEKATYNPGTACIWYAVSGKNTTAPKGHTHSSDEACVTALRERIDKLVKKKGGEYKIVKIRDIRIIEDVL